LPGVVTAFGLGSGRAAARISAAALSPVAQIMGLVVIVVDTVVLVGTVAAA